MSFVKADGLLNGHPGSSKLDLFEGMLQKGPGALDANPELKAQTVLFITMPTAADITTAGMFGDGPRIPLVVESPYSTGGHVCTATTSMSRS